MINKDNKGFSLIELLVVVAILALAVTFVGGSMVSVYNAGAKKAAEQINAMLAQSKIDAMSGMPCKFELGYSDTDECYYVALYSSDGTNFNEYKREYLDKQETKAMRINRSLTITVGKEDGTDTQTVTSTNKITIFFNTSNGRVDSAAIGTNDLYASTVKTVITVISGNSNRTITLYKGTGEHVLA